MTLSIICGSVYHIQRPADRHIHIEVTVGAEAADKGDLGFSRSEGFVLFEQGFFLHEADRVVGDVVLTGEARVLLEADGVLVGFPRREVLVFGDAGVGHLGIGIVHHGSALEITFGANFAEFERAITETTEAISEVTVEWT